MNIPNKRKKIGKYLLYLNQELGIGSFAKVYKGVDQATSEFVAIKMVNRQTIQQDQYTKNAFISQIQIMKHLKSKNIIRFLDVFETTNNYYIIQQLATGGTLRKRMVNHRFSEEESVAFMIQILNGFGQMVKNGIIHRDIKPQNILIQNNLLKIADFGFAKQSDNNSFMKTIIGTPLYMSPQILSNQPYTYKCDIWALGVLFYQLVMGCPPWPMKEKHKLSTIKNNPIKFAEQIKIHPLIKQFILGCLQYDQQKRYDWQHIYSHPLFAKIFKQNFQDMQDSPIQLAFILSSMRMSVHSQNLNIAKIIDQLPDNLTQLQLIEKDLSEVLPLMDSSITQNQVKIVFEKCWKTAKLSQKTRLPKEKLKQFLVSFGIRMKSLDFSEMLTSSIVNRPKQQVEQKTFSSNLVSRLRKQMQQSDIDLYDLYRIQDKKKNNALEFPEFTKLVKQIDKTLTEQEIKILFKQFDLNKDETISFKQFHRTMCKIAGVVQVDDLRKTQILKKKKE